ncbi:MAG: DUF1566 domain-containing protein [Spirochaetaceae bacterium]|jgi:hypothetical protein|nr:DUF1566 domain-containing protein [Spirochaetaceae bacterium]
MRKKSIFLGMTAMAFVLGMAFAGCDISTGSDAGTYPVGGRGPAGGWIFYDKGEFSDGWRYLEAAPVDISVTAAWGAYPDGVPGTATGIGAGKANTQIIVTKYPTPSNYAANCCDAYVYGLFDDWFLPSKDELNLMWTNLKRLDLVPFNGISYWSSSQSNTYFSWYQLFNTGYQGYGAKDGTGSIRAVRAF